MRFDWPPGFLRVPPDEWTQRSVEDLALNYDTVERHGWYANLDPTVAELAGALREGDVLVDYSGGTGILIDRLLHALPTREFGVVDVDSSPKFLRLALHKLASEERVAFRLIRWVKEERRLQRVDEVLGPLVGRVDAIVSTNAIHLYSDLDETIGSWRRVLRPGGTVLAQSGNIDRPGREPSRWIIDRTVEAVADAAETVVREDARFAHWRLALDDPTRRAAHAAQRAKVFLPVRPVEHYLSAFKSAGLDVVRVDHRPIVARTPEWLAFLGVYHDAILGWVGGTEKVDGRLASPEAVADRMEILRRAVERVFDGEETFTAEWTYLRAERAPR